ncbi:patched family [Cryptosporidium sp. chipmunk genotype I]|uniref:patched family n=1 Tax=Cryptosporidium sp. chipmunk genotype I TaxID=1280935 RepID=UPI00351A8D5E|nr:patched family [Cryptosporidium sp. chipmunk genotype I]
MREGRNDQNLNFINSREHNRDKDAVMEQRREMQKEIEMEREYFRGAERSCEEFKSVRDRKNDSNEKGRKVSVKKVGVFLRQLANVQPDIVDFVATRFGVLGGIIYEKPWYFILGSVLLTLVCSIGFIPGIPRWVDSAEQLYSLPYSLARDHGKLHDQLFSNTKSRSQLIVITSQTPGENVFTWEFLEIVSQVNKLIRGEALDAVGGRRVGVKIGPSSSGDKNLDGEHSEDGNSKSRKREEYLSDTKDDKYGSNEVDPFRLSHETFLTYNNICTMTPFGTCSVQNVIEAGALEMKEVLGDEDPELYMLDGFVFNLRKQAFLPDYILGKMKTKPCVRTLPTDLISKILSPEKYSSSSKGPGFSDARIDCIIGAKAFLMVYDIFDDGTPENLSRNLLWEQSLVSILKDNRDWGRARISFSAFRSRDDELKASTSENSDILLVGLTFTLLFFYVGVANFSFDLYKMKTYSGLAGLFAALLGLASGMGLMSILGVSFVPTVLVTPFLIMGAAVNYLFVIVNAYSTGYTIPSTKERCRLALQDSVIGITITMCTGLVSFSIGAVGEPYLSIRNFCLFSAASIIFTYLYVFFFMFPVLCLDAKREVSRRVHFFGLPKLTSNDIKATRDLNLGRSIPVDNISSFAVVSYNLSRALREYNIQLYPFGEYDKGENEQGFFDVEQDSDTKLDFSSIQDKKMGFHIEQGNGTVVCNKMSFFTRLRKRLFHIPILAKYECSDRKVTSESTIPSFNQLRHEMRLSDFDLVSRELDPNILETIKNNNQIIQKKDHSNNLQILQNISIEKLEKEYDLNHVDDLLQILLAEPLGNVGRTTRRVMLHYVGPIMATPIVKIIVIIIWLGFLGVSIYGFTKMESGLDLRDLSPPSSYLQAFDQDFTRYFSEYDLPTDVYFPEKLEWWRRAVQDRIFDFVERLERLESTQRVIDPLYSLMKNPELATALRSGNRKLFQETLYYELYSNPESNYKQFSFDFVWKERELVTYRIKLLAKGMPTSQQKADWMTSIRKLCDDEEKREKIPFKVVAYNYMMLFYESDLSILTECFSNMLSCGIAIELITLMLIPELMSGLFVIILMACIDIGLFGFMYYWNVKLNMVSMINLLLSMGFAVDYSTLMTHTFSHCYGKTRNHRMIESLGLMGAPVCHGAMSTFLGVVVLSGSSSYIFTVFFKMMVMVVGFGIFHGAVVLPILLSLVGRMPSHSSNILYQVIEWIQNSHSYSPNSISKGNLPMIKAPPESSIELDEQMISADLSLEKNVIPSSTVDFLKVSKNSKLQY